MGRCRRRGSPGQHDARAPDRSTARWHWPHSRTVLDDLGRGRVGVGEDDLGWRRSPRMEYTAGSRPPEPLLTRLESSRTERGVSAIVTGHAARRRGRETAGMYDRGAPRARPVSASWRARRDGSTRPAQWGPPDATHQTIHDRDPHRPVDARRVQRRRVAVRRLVSVRRRVAVRRRVSRPPPRRRPPDRR